MSTLTYLPSAIGQTAESWWNDLTGQKNSNPAGGGSYVSNAAINQGLSGNAFGGAASAVNASTQTVLTSTGKVAKTVGGTLLSSISITSSAVAVVIVIAGLAGLWYLAEKMP